MIDQKSIEEVKERANIVSVVSDYVQIKKRGKNYLGLCPFHSEKTPSFTVSEEKQLFHCFGCGKGGNLFTFVMEMEKVNFAEAVEILADKLGIKLEKTGGSGISKSEKDKLFEQAESACKLYESSLDKNNAARKYLAGRKLQPETIQKFRLGYDQNGDRVMFPIFDIRGRVVGFSGRALGGNGPKYLNSPDSPIFYKGGTLYGLNFAKDAIKKNNFALLVEGNVDLVTCHQAGVTNAVAPLGTALTADHAKLLARHGETVVLAYDSDAAGLAAAERVTEILKEAGSKVRILDLGKFKDPDEFINAAGREAFLEAIKQSAPALEFKIRRIVGRFNLNEVESRARAAFEVANLLTREKEPLMQKEYIKFAANLLGLDETLVAAEVNRHTFYKKTGGVTLRKVTGRPPNAIVEAERTLIRLALESDENLGLIKETLTAEEFTDPVLSAVFHALLSHPREELLDNLPDEAGRRAAREALLSEYAVDNKNDVIRDCINTLKAFTLRKQLDKLKSDIERAEKDGQMNELKNLNYEFQGLSEILRSYAR
ncbi:MAG: CHC2 zinc finger domain-containing protein [Candidatus Margulisiibacteriota bacterium]